MCLKVMTPCFHVLMEARGMTFVTHRKTSILEEKVYSDLLDCVDF